MAEVRLEVFAIAADTMPTVDELDKIEPRQKVIAARKMFAELPLAGYEAFAKLLPEQTGVSKLWTPLPDLALPIIFLAHCSKLFDCIKVLSAADASEFLLLGVVRCGDRCYYFKLVHWGERLSQVNALPEIDQLTVVGPRSDQRRFSNDGALLALTALVGVACLPLLYIGWWVYAGALAAGMTACGVFCVRRTRWRASVRGSVAWLIVAFAIAAVVIGGFRFESWYTDDRTVEALVCQVNYDPPRGVWQFFTSKGKIVVERGFYNGVYYDSVNAALAAQFTGQWARLTLHGYSMNGIAQGPFATAGTVLRSGVCG